MKGGGDLESQTLNYQSPLIIRQVIIKFDTSEATEYFHQSGHFNNPLRKNEQISVMIQIMDNQKFFFLYSTFKNKVTKCFTEHQK